MRKLAATLALILACSRETPITETKTETHHVRDATKMTISGETASDEKAHEVTAQEPATNIPKPIPRPVRPLSFAKPESVASSSRLAALPQITAATCPHAATLTRYVADARASKYRDGYDWLLTPLGCYAYTQWLASKNAGGFVQWLGDNGYQSPAARCEYTKIITTPIEVDIARYEVWHETVPEDIAVVYAPANWKGSGSFIAQFELGCWPNAEFFAQPVVRDVRQLEVCCKGGVQ